MNIYERLQLTLRKYRDDGSTNAELSRKAGVSQAHINRLLNGSAEQFATLQLGTALRLFPDLLRLDGASISQTATGGSVAINGNNNTASAANVDNVTDAILNDESMCDKCRITALRHIRNAKARSEKP